jgi:hypothetical protein
MHRLIAMWTRYKYVGNDDQHRYTIREHVLCVVVRILCMYWYRIDRYKEGIVLDAPTVPTVSVDRARIRS